MWGVDFMDLDSPKDDEPIIVQDESDEQVHAEKVMDTSIIDKNKPKRTKPEHEIGRVQEIKAEGELVRIGGLGLKNENALQALESSSTLYK
ncbi:hypothetical protein Tco_0527200 [Tanacetum coccineum]